MKKKILFIFLVLFSIFSLLITSSCVSDNNTDIEDKTTNTEVETEVKEPITLETLEGLVFVDGTFEYDGELHEILVQNVPEGVNVSYHNNNRSKPGEYKITATITYEDLKVTKTAKLIIKHKESVISTDLEQTVYIYGNSSLLPEYTLNNEEQAVEFVIYKDGVKVSEDELINPGTYEVEIIAKKSTYYAESKQTVSLTTTYSLFNLSFEDSTVTYDGLEHEIKLNGIENLPAGYTVEYSDNVATEAGTYLALANVKDASGAVVETHAAVLSIENPTNEEFEKYLDEFFVWYLEGDQLSVNILVENPSNFGLEHYDASWYSYETPTLEEFEHDIKLINDVILELETYKNLRLSKIQEVTYRNIENYLNDMLSFYEIEDAWLMNLRYVDQFGGYVADFSTYMESYSFRSEQDVIDIISYIKSTKEAFPSYLKFLDDRAQNGYALSDFTITEMQGYLEEVLADRDSYYLADVINAHIDAVDFLNDEDKANYKQQVSTEMVDSYMNGVEALYNGLKDYLGLLPATEQGYLAVYKNGKELYLNDLKSLLGLKNFDPETYVKQVEDMLSESAKQSESLLNIIIRQNNITTQLQLDKFLDSKLICDGTPEEMMEYLKEFAPTIVPELKSDPEIIIKNMDDASAAVSNANAYYMKSPVDNTGAEEITLNPLNLDLKNELISTLAHEGYPGHLYAYVYSKEIGQHVLNTIMTSTAHAEGWATYVELKLYEYAKERTNDPDLQLILDYLYANQLSGFLLETRIDFGIHYEGWKVKDVSSYLGSLGYNAAAGQEIYDLIIEMPTTYAAYGYGKLLFVQLHEEAKALLGSHYDEIEFNAMLLSRGWSTLGELENTYNEYMTAKCHKYGVEFSPR